MSLRKISNLSTSKMPNHNDDYSAEVLNALYSRYDMHNGVAGNLTFDRALSDKEIQEVAELCSSTDGKHKVYQAWHCKATNAFRVCLGFE